MHRNSISVLQENKNFLISSLGWLERSYNQCRNIGIKSEYTDDEYDSYENLTSRFARTTDLLVNKVMRSIDAAELIEPGSLIDTVNRATSRGIVDSTEQIRNLKDLRNEIAHEYEPETLAELFTAVLDSVPGLIKLSERTVEYCEQLISDQSSE